MHFIGVQTAGLLEYIYIYIYRLQHSSCVRVRRSHELIHEHFECRLNFEITSDV
jgi:hypothetical protein